MQFRGKFAAWEGHDLLGQLGCHENVYVLALAC